MQSHQLPVVATAMRIDYLTRREVVWRVFRHEDLLIQGEWIAVVLSLALLPSGDGCGDWPVDRIYIAVLMSHFVSTPETIMSAQSQR